VVHLTEDGIAGLSDTFGIRADWAS